MTNTIDSITRHDALIEAVNKLGLHAELGALVYALGGEQGGTQVYVGGIERLDNTRHSLEVLQDMLRGLVYRAAIRQCNAEAIAWATTQPDPRYLRRAESIRRTLLA